MILCFLIYLMIDMSFHDDLLTIRNIQSFFCRLTHKAATVERVPGSILYFPVSAFHDFVYSRLVTLDDYPQGPAACMGSAECSLNG